MRKFVTSESVCEGHPDKICDQISDAILDAYLIGDPDSRVAIECLIKDDKLVIAGEVTSKTKVDLPNTALKVLKDIGYEEDLVEKYANNLTVFVSKQSPDIAQGVDQEGAGDQGMMYGYACQDTPELMPMPIMLAHGICKRMAKCRHADPENCPLLPDGKAQVTVAYEEENKPDYIDTIVVSSQHKPYDTENSKEQAKFEKYIIDEIIKPVIDKKLFDWEKGEILINPHKQNGNGQQNLVDRIKETNERHLKLFINPTGKFEVGGAFGDCGVTGRKIVVDGYGGVGRVGGGCFSGKDPSKVDRSAAYMARYLAKHLVKQGFGEEIEVSLSYAIGVAQPVDIAISGQLSKPAEEVYSYIRDNFDLSPKGIIKFLDLKKPIYRKTASFGHFGREEFSWEKA